MRNIGRYVVIRNVSGWEWVIYELLYIFFNDV